MSVFAPHPVKHNSSHFSNHAQACAVATIEAAAGATIKRARWAAALKCRLVLKIPYHEWQEAVRRANLQWRQNVPTFNAQPIEALLDAYTPRGLHILRDYVDAPRYAPWASRHQRGGMPLQIEALIGHVQAHVDRITGGWGSLRATFETERPGGLAAAARRRPRWLEAAERPRTLSARMRDRNT